MEKPEKKEVKDILKGRMVGNNTYVWARGYNQACKEWEKYLEELKGDFGEFLVRKYNKD